MYNAKDLILDGEIWKDIKGYENLYQASNFGRIKGVANRVTFSKRHGIRHWKERILKPKLENDYKTGYRVTLWKNKIPKDYLMARLICSTFYGDSDLTVNHKDGNRLNNNIENLEWLSLGDNIRHAFDNDLMNNSCKKVILFNKEEELKFRSMAKAGLAIGRNKGYISNCVLANKEATHINGTIYNIKLIGGTYIK